MTTSRASSPDLVAPSAVPQPRASWIESPAFDLTFFILAPVLALPLILASSLGLGFAGIVAFVLALSHYLSSFSFFFWDENQARHRARWLAFFAGPVVIVVSFWLLVAFRVPLVIQVLLFSWNTYHVALQSCGVVSIYRHRAGVFDPAQKAIANAGILSTNAWFALWNIESHKEVIPVLNAISPSSAQALRFGLGAVALVCLLRVAASLWGRAAAGKGPSIPELGAFVTAIALFHPYLWASTSEAATFAMLLPHYVQYLGIVWLLHRRKFREPAGSLPQVLLQRLSASTPALIGTLLTLSLGFLAAKRLFGLVGQAENFEALYLLLAFVHFYLDGLFWAFKDPHVRRTIGPYLTRGSPDPLVAAVGAY